PVGGLWRFVRRVIDPVGHTDSQSSVGISPFEAGASMGIHGCESNKIPGNPGPRTQASVLGSNTVRICWYSLCPSRSGKKMATFSSNSRLPLCGGMKLLIFFLFIFRCSPWPASVTMCPYLGLANGSWSYGTSIYPSPVPSNEVFLGATQPVGDGG